MIIIVVAFYLASTANLDVLEFFFL